MYSSISDKLKMIPIPIAGLVLAMLSCGVFMQLHDLYGAAFFIGTGLLLQLLLVIRIILFPVYFYRQLNHPVIITVAPTISMSLMITAVILHTLPLAFSLWLGALILHLLLLVKLIIAVIKHDILLKDILPSWFIPFVGACIIATTAPVFNAYELGRIVWIFSFINYCWLLPLILYHIFITKNFIQQQLPLIVILTAPGSLCLAGYLSVMYNKNLLLVAILYSLSQICYVIAVLHLPRILKGTFYPSYSALTFPLVISASASYLTLNINGLSINLISFLRWIVDVEWLVAIMMVTYVFIRYAFYLYELWFLIDKHQKNINI